MLDESVSSSPSIWTVVYSWFTPTVFFLLLQLMIGTIFITSSFNNKKNHNQTESHDDHNLHPPQLARSPSVLERLKSINFYSYRSHDSPHNPQELHAYNDDNPHSPLTRSPSMLQRLKSINLHNYFPTEAISSRFSPHEATVMNVANEPESEPEKRHFEFPPAAAEEEDEVEESDGGGEIERCEAERSIDEIYSELQGVHVTRTKSDTKPASGEVPVKLSRKMKKSATTKSAFAHFKEEDVVVVEKRRPATVREAKMSASEADDDEVDAKADDFINKFKKQLQLQRLDSITRYKETIHRRG